MEKLIGLLMWAHLHIEYYYIFFSVVFFCWRWPLYCQSFVECSFALEMKTGFYFFFSANSFAMQWKKKKKLHKFTIGLFNVYRKGRNLCVTVWILNIHLLFVDVFFFFVFALCFVSHMRLLTLNTNYYYRILGWNVM